MHLEPVATVPDTLAGEVQAINGRVAVGMHDGALVLVLTCLHPSIAELDAAGVDGLLDLLADARARMGRARTGRG